MHQMDLLHDLAEHKDQNRSIHCLWKYYHNVHTSSPLDHAEDPFDAFTRPTTNQSLLYFVQMMKAITGTEWAGKIPSDLPIYNIGGDQDPVGEYGKGIYEVTNWLVDTGHTVKTRVYSGNRHEIHNYDEIKDEVEAGIISFMDSILDE